MASILEQAQSLFESRPMLKVEVPEWSADPARPVVIHFKMPSPAVVAKVMREASGDAIEQGARLVALLAVDEAGTRLFSNLDYESLMTTVDARGLARVYNAMNNAGRISDAALEQAEKN